MYELNLAVRESCARLKAAVLPVGRGITEHFLPV